MSKLVCDCGEQLVCPKCGPVELVVAAPEPPPRRWARRVALAALALLAVGGCAWWALAR